MVEERLKICSILGEDLGTTQKAQQGTGTGSFAGLVISFCQISVITASNQIVSGTEIRILLVAVDACSPSPSIPSLHFFYVEALMDKQMQFKKNKVSIYRVRYSISRALVVEI